MKEIFEVHNPSKVFPKWDKSKNLNDYVSSSMNTVEEELLKGHWTKEDGGLVTLIPEHSQFVICHAEKRLEELGAQLVEVIPHYNKDSGKYQFMGRFYSPITE